MTSASKAVCGGGEAEQRPEPGDLLYHSEWETERAISHEEAREIAGRLINSHFNNPGEHARVGIPARPDYDDDLLIHSYIKQQARKDAALASTAGAGAGDWVTVPKVPPEAMWGGLARQIVMWCRFGQPTGKALFQHLKSSGYEIPAWLREEVENVDHVPPKGTVAVIIYRAMIEAAPAVPASPIKGGGTPTWPASYQETFDAIAAAVTVHDGTTFGISVKAFYRALAYPETAPPPAHAEHGVEIREAAEAAFREGWRANLPSDTADDPETVAFIADLEQEAWDASQTKASLAAPAQSPSTSDAEG